MTLLHCPIILYVDDDASNIDTFRRVFRFDYSLLTALSGPEALEILKSNRDIAVILSDQRMPKMTGVEFLKEAQKINPYAQRIMLTAFTDNEALLQAIQTGHVYDYVVKPWEKDELKRTIDQALGIYEDRIEKIKRLKVAEQRSAVLEAQLAENPDERKIVGTALKPFLSQVQKIAATDSTVLIRGETGTGKELIAQSIHSQSRRSAKPFIKVNCAALSPTLIESELFGHEKGAFTGALSQKSGRFELADGGTLFLDEIGDLPPDVQAKLLRVLQEGEFEKVGGTQTLKTDFRLICATHQDLEAHVRGGKFREDLYFRINVIPIPLPPLRERPGDIAELVDHFVRRFSKELGKNVTATSEALNLLSTYDWPGNIRELSNVIERAVVLASDSSLSPEDFALNPLSSQKLVQEWEEKAVTSFRDNLGQEEARGLADGLRKAQGNISTLARAMNVPRSTLVHRLKKYKLI